MPAGSGGKPCSQCKKSGLECDLSRSNIRFRPHKSRPKPDLTFSPVQKWVGTTGKVRFVDVSEEYYSQNSPQSKAVQASVSGHSATQPDSSSTSSTDGHDAEYPFFSSGPGPLYTPETTTVSPQSASGLAVALFPSGMGPNHSDHTRSIYPAQRDGYPLGPLKGLPDSASSQAFVTDIEEACLIRHFINDLAPWVRYQLACCLWIQTDVDKN